MTLLDSETVYAGEFMLEVGLDVEKDASALKSQTVSTVTSKQLESQSRCLVEGLTDDYARQIVHKGSKEITLGPLRFPFTNLSPLHVNRRLQHC